ncbi:hypothetical protein L9Z41_16630 [Leptospira noguchii]|nr:hypothetical protein [Leptospira noguchii]MCH1917210.1 hypothetical protein [Leptospira noguchii]
MARKRRSYYKNLGIETSVHVAKLDASDAAVRLDTLMHIASGKGIVGRDKLRGISANPIRIMPETPARYTNRMDSWQTSSTL